MIKALGALMATFGSFFLLAFPVLEILGVWSSGDIVHRFVGSGFLSLLFGLILLFGGWFIYDEG